MRRARRRLVTVLFADLVGSTSLAEALDPEDVDAVLRRYFEVAAACVRRHGGEVEKFIGDAVVAAFGVRADVEDAALRAVAAAVDLRDAVSALAGELAWLDRPLVVRVGVNTGEVVVTDQGDGWRLAGDAVNIAARLQAVAPPGEVLIGAETALAVAATVDLDELAPQHLAGKGAAVRAWRVGGQAAAIARVGSALPQVGSAQPQVGSALPQVRSAQPQVGSALPLIGRDDDVAALAAAVRTAGTAHLLVATPGLGRSRLLAAVAAALHDRSVVVVTTPADAHDRPYAAVAALFTAAAAAASPSEPAVGLLERLTEAAATPVASFGLQLAAGLLRGDDLDLPRPERFAAWRAALDVVLPDPAVVVVDDLHLASVDARSFVAGLPATLPVPRTVLASARPASLLTTDGGSAGTGARPGRVWHLDPLADADVAALLDVAVGGPGAGSALPDAVRHAIVAAAAGTPLFVVELLRRWQVAGLLVTDTEHGGWRLLDTSAPPDVPSTLQALYTGELDRLPPGPRDVVSVASVPGVRFPAEALPTLGAPAPAPALTALVDAGLFEAAAATPVTGPEYAFRHPLLRDVAYGELLRTERSELHLAYARWLAERGDEAALDAAIARQLDAAVDALPRADDDRRRPLAEEAAERWERAARRDLVAAPERAALRAQRAIARGGETARRVALLGDALARTGDFLAAADAHARAVEIATTPRDRATAALAHEQALLDGRLDRRSAAGRRSEALLTAALADDLDDDTRAELLAARGQARAWAGGARAGEQDRRGSVDLARRAGRPATLAAVLLAARATHREASHLDRRLAEAREAAAAADGTGDDTLGLEADRSLLVDLWASGAPTVEIATLLARCVARVERLRQPSRWWYPPMWRAAEALRVGDLAAAEAATDELAAAGTAARYRDVDAVVLAQRVHLDRDRGAPDRARDRLTGVLADEPLRWAGLAAAAAVWAGDLRGARRAAAVHLDHGLANVPDDLARAWHLALLAEAAAALDEPGWAATVRAALAPYAGQIVVVGAGALVDGAVDRRLGLLARAIGDPTAAHHLTAAADLEAGSGAAPALARTRAVLTTLPGSLEVH